MRSIDFFEMDEVRDRVVLLIRQAGPKKLSEIGGKNHDRWKNISRGAIRPGTEEVGILATLFPEYALWLVTGRIEPENGHRSPDFDEANRKLQNQSVG